MKKFKLIMTVAVFAVISYSCNNSAVERMVDKMQPEPVVIEQEGAGFFVNEPGEKFVAGSDDVMDVWMKYIDAHNNQDMESILAMETDSIFILSPDGTSIRGKENHQAALSAWFEAASPKWDVYWGMPYKGVTGGADWIIAGHVVTQTIDGAEVKHRDMIDGYINEDGLVSMFFVYRSEMPVPVSEETSEAEE